MHKNRHMVDRRLTKLTDTECGGIEIDATRARLIEDPKVQARLDPPFGEELDALLQAYEQELPIGYVFDYATFQPDLIRDSVQGAVSNVYQTLAIVLAVVMLFLGLRKRKDSYTVNGVAGRCIKESVDKDQFWNTV